MDFAIILEDRILNVVKSDEAFASKQGWVPLLDGFGVGDSFDGVDFTKSDPETILEVPQVISYAQGKRAMIRRGYWQLANAYVDAIEDETERLLAQSALNDPTEFHRESPFLLYLAGVLEIPDSEVDEMFIEGAADII